jgi:hypothetical protein
VHICRKPPNIWGNYNKQIYTSNKLIVASKQHASENEWSWCNTSDNVLSVMKEYIYIEVHALRGKEES